MSTSIADVFVQIGVNGLSAVMSGIDMLGSKLGRMGSLATTLFSGVGGVMFGFGQELARATGLTSVMSTGFTLLSMAAVAAMPHLRSFGSWATSIGRAVAPAWMRELGADMAKLPSIARSVVSAISESFKYLVRLNMTDDLIIAWKSFKANVAQSSSGGAAIGRSFADAFVQGMKNGFNAAVNGAATALAPLILSLSDSMEKFGRDMAGKARRVGIRINKAIAAGGMSGAAARGGKGIAQLLFGATASLGGSLIAAPLAAILSMMGKTTAALATLNAQWGHFVTAVKGGGNIILASLTAVTLAAKNLGQAIGVGLAKSAQWSVSQIISLMKQAGSSILRVLNSIQQVSFGFRMILAPAARVAASAISSIWAMAMGPLGLLWKAITSIGAQVGFVFGAAGAWMIGRKITEVSSDAEQAAISFEVMLGSAGKARTMLSHIQKLADSTPLQLPEVRQGARSLLAMNVAAERVVPSLKMLGDISQGVQIPLNDLVQIYGKINQKNRIMGDDLRQFGRRGIPVVRELAKEFNTTTDAIYEMARAGQLHFKDLDGAFMRLTGKGGEFHNMMERISQTLAGRWSTFSDSVRQVAIRIGGALTPAMKTALNSAIKFTDTLVTSGKVDAFANQLTYAFNAAAKAVPVVIDRVSAALPIIMQFGRMVLSMGKSAYEAFTMVSDSVNQLIPGIGSLGDKLLAALEIGQFMAENWQTLFLMMLEEVKLFGSNAGKAISAFFAYAAQLAVWFGNNWQEIMLSAADIVLGIMENLGKNIRAIWNATMEFVQGKGFQPDLTPLLDGTKQAIDRILATMPKMADGILDETTPAIEQLKRELGSAWVEFDKRKQERENFKAKREKEEPLGNSQSKEGIAEGKDKQKIAFDSLTEYARNIQQSVTPRERKNDQLLKQQAGDIHKLANEGIKVKNLGVGGAVFNT